VLSCIWGLLSMKDEEKMKTVKEFAEQFKVNKNTVYAWIWQGKIKAIKIGRAIRIPESEFEARVVKPKKRKRA